MTKMQYYVKCPYCGRVRVTRSKKVVRCFYCGRRFAVVPKRGRSRIVGVRE